MSKSLKDEVARVAKREGASINQLISSAVSEKISAIMTEEYLQKRADRANIEDMKVVLKKVATRKPLAGDEI